VGVAVLAMGDEGLEVDVKREGVERGEVFELDILHGNGGAETSTGTEGIRPVNERWMLGKEDRCGMASEGL
jgi:hypothetical protein